MGAELSPYGVRRVLWKENHGGELFNLFSGKVTCPNSLGIFGGVEEVDESGRDGLEKRRWAGVAYSRVVIEFGGVEGPDLAHGYMGAVV